MSDKVEFNASFSSSDESFAPSYGNTKSESYSPGYGSTTEVPVPGPPGPQGEPGPQGPAGYTPQKGIDYFDGKDGRDGVDGKDGYTPIKGVDYFDGKDGKDGSDGAPGKDGYIPVKGIDYFDGKDGAAGSDGKDGADGSPGSDGKDGVSPKVSVTTITGGHRISITDANGTKTVDVMDGTDGKDGSDGQAGSPGKDGNAGKDGADGVGIASVKQTTTSTADDGNNIITVTLTNGQTATFTVQNGSKGSPGADGSDGKDGKDGSDANVTAANIKSALGYDPANPSSIPTKVSQLDNDVKYATKGELSVIPKFNIEVVGTLPTAGISKSTLYLLQTQITAPEGEVSNSFAEYIFIPHSSPDANGYYESMNGYWELLGDGSIDLTDYAKKSELPTKTSQLNNDSGFITSIPSEYVTETELTNKGYAKQTEVDSLSEEIANFSAIAYGVCSTAADTVAKEVTVSDENFELKEGAVVIVRFINANSIASPTLNVNGTGAKPLYRYGTTTMSTGTTTTGWVAGAIQMFVYNGTGWIRDYWNNTTYSNASLGQGWTVCETAEATLAKTATISAYGLVLNGIVAVKFNNAVPAGSTLNITSKGAKPIYSKGSAIKAGVIKAGDTATFIYHDSKYHLIASDRWDTDIANLSSEVTKIKALLVDGNEVEY